MVQLKNLFKMVVFLAVPIILENLFQTLLGTADTYFAGKLDDTAIAAIGVTNLIMNVLISFYSAVSVGTAAVIARYVGRQDFESVKQAISQAIILGLGLGVSVGVISFILCRPVLTLAGSETQVMEYAIPYYMIVAVPSVFLCMSQILSSCLRSMRDTKTPMLVSAASNVVNIFLNMLFIRLGMGIIGLALATTISRILMMVLLLFRLKYNKINFSLQGIRVYMPMIRDIVKIGLPAGGEKLIMRIGQLVYNGMIISLGTSCYVAHTIGGTIESYTYIPAVGFGTAIATLVGISLGEEDIPKAKMTTFVAYGVTAFCMSCIGLGMYIFAPQLAAMFTKTLAVQSLVVMILRLIALFQPFAALTQVMTGALQGAGDTKVPMYATMIGIWVIRVGIGYFLAVPMQLGLLGIWAGYAADIVFRGIFLFARFVGKNSFRVKIGV